MPRASAGLLPVRRNPGSSLEVLIVHPGGPLWTNKDDGAWSIAKGEYEEGQDPLQAAEREFREELGLAPPIGERVYLGEVKQAGGKRVVAWAIFGDLDIREAQSNSFELEWPPGSGKLQAYPEIDRAAWFSVERAKAKLLHGQVALIERLLEMTNDAGNGVNQ